jgi:predicted ferric reductase
MPSQASYAPPESRSARLPTRPSRRQPASRPPHRETVAAHPLTADALVAAGGLGLGVVLASAVTSLSARMLQAPGGEMVAVGRLTGLAGAYLLLVMVVLVARIAALERLVGHPRLTRWHRRLAPWPLLLLGVHATASIAGYARMQRTGVWHEFSLALSHYEGMIAAVLSLAMLVAISAASIRAARKRMRHETWWSLHLAMYIALALSFSHQIATGASFVHHPLARIAWTALWLSTAGVVLAYRVLMPAWRSAYHRLSVVKVAQEAEDVWSVVVKGRHVQRLAVSGGQFFHWRFLTRGLWLHSHPFSLSALPWAPYMRLTIQGGGEHSSMIAELKPGTRIAIEGPYGTLTKHAGTGQRVALIGAAVGATPLRALLEDLPFGCEPIVLLRASTRDQLVLENEIRDLAHDRGGRLIELVGSRTQVPLDPAALSSLIPDIASRDVYICGSRSFADAVRASATALHVPAGQLHIEAFGD